MNSEALMYEVLPYAILLAFSLLPYIYILLKKGNYKFLFCSACIGAIFLMLQILYVFALPFWILLTWVMPQLADFGQVEYILPLLSFSDFVKEYHLIVLLPLLSLTLPVLVYRRYAIFKKSR